MNTMDSLRRVLEYATSYLDIVPGTAAKNEDIAAIDNLIAAFDALEPKPDMWATYPFAQWYAVDANGGAVFSKQEPEIDGIVWVMDWTNKSDLPIDMGTVDIPLGLDWRLCKWQRPEVTP